MFAPPKITQLSVGTEYGIYYDYHQPLFCIYRADVVVTLVVAIFAYLIVFKPWRKE